MWNSENQTFMPVNGSDSWYTNQACEPTQHDPFQSLDCSTQPAQYYQAIDKSRCNVNQAYPTSFHYTLSNNPNTYFTNLQYDLDDQCYPSANYQLTTNPNNPNAFLIQDNNNNNSSDLNGQLTNYAVQTNQAAGSGIVQALPYTSPTETHLYQLTPPSSSSYGAQYPPLTYSDSVGLSPPTQPNHLQPPDGYFTPLIACPRDSTETANSIYSQDGWAMCDDKSAAQNQEQFYSRDKSCEGNDEWFLENLPTVEQELSSVLGFPEICDNVDTPQNNYVDEFIQVKPEPEFGDSQCNAPQFTNLTDLNRVKKEPIIAKQKSKKSSSQLKPRSSGSSFFWQYNSQCKGPKAELITNLLDNSDESDCPNRTPMLAETYPNPPSSSSTSQPGDDGSIEPGCSFTTPKRRRLIRYSSSGNPRVLDVFHDPVEKRHELVHCAKLRRGDGNDVTPNPTRLHQLGQELDRLSAEMHHQSSLAVSGGGGVLLSPPLLKGENGHEGNDAVEMGGRLFGDPSFDSIAECAKREKNKLASKICRLKKKAFHESNKIKYSGLGIEHEQLMSVIRSIKGLLVTRFHRDNPSHQTDRLLTNGSRKRNATALICDTATSDLSTTSQSAHMFNSSQPGYNLPGTMPENVGFYECKSPVDRFGRDLGASLHQLANQTLSHLNVSVAERSDYFVQEVLDLIREPMRKASCHTSTQHPLLSQLTCEGGTKQPLSPIISEDNTTTTAAAYTSLLGDENLECLSSPSGGDAGGYGTMNATSFYSPPLPMPPPPDYHLNSPPSSILHMPIKNEIQDS